jgi:hypothetical protein
MSGVSNLQGSTTISAIVLVRYPKCQELKQSICFNATEYGSSQTQASTSLHVTVHLGNGEHISVRSRRCREKLVKQRSIYGHVAGPFGSRLLKVSSPESRHCYKNADCGGRSQ